MIDTTASGSMHLVEAIEQTIGHVLAPPVRRAFLAVDRHHFVPQYYIQEGRQWIRQKAGLEVYENRAFFTHLDARGVPDSSSSQPSLMAPMLEALDVQPGQRILEIGTGSGYNAALVGEIVGKNGAVVSVDIAADLVEQAATRLTGMPWVKTAVADGLLGYAKLAPYDRIIVTGGAETVPRPWLEQLKVGGILVGNLALHLGTPTPLYRLVKQEDGSVCGSFLTTPAFFMGLHHEGKSTPKTPDFASYETLPLIEQVQTLLDMPHLLKDPGLALFVEQRRLSGLESHLRLPGNSLSRQARTVQTCFLLPGRALLTFIRGEDSQTRFEIEVRGREPLWFPLLAAYTEWEQPGRPALDRYRVTVDQDGQLSIAL